MQATGSITRRGEYYGTLAFTGTGLGAFSTYLFANRIDGAPWQVAGAFLLGGGFMVLGVFCQYTIGAGAPRRLHIYFAVQTVLALGAVILSPLRGFFAILILPLISQAILCYAWQVGVAFGLLGYVGSCSIFWWLYGWSAFWEAMLSYSPAYLFTIVFTFVTRDALRAREHALRLSHDLQAANARLREQADQTHELATTRERNRLAREIHDGVGHYLTVINVQLDAARSLLERDPAQAANVLAKASRLSREALDDVRRSVGSLRTEEAHRALPEVLRDLVIDAGLPIDFAVGGEPRPLSAAAEHALFRAAQEGLTNVRKHAAATHAELRLDFRSDKRICLQLRDNGRGGASAPAAAADSAGFGLRGMRERVALLGGQVQTANPPGGGFLLTVEVPA